MVAVNVLGRFHIMPEILRHARFESFSFADAVAPFFFFTVGMGLRISFLRNKSELGEAPAITRAARRFLKLILISIFVYHFNPSKIFWGDALTQIGFGGLLAIPVINMRSGYRMILPPMYIIAFLLIKTFLWKIPKGLELVSCTFLILVGSVVADWLIDRPETLVSKSLCWGLAVFLLGWIVTSFFSKNIIILAYGLIYTSLSILLFLGFYYLVDGLKFPIFNFTTLGRNALVVYILHYYIDNDMRKLIPDDAGILMAMVAISVVYFGCYTVVRYLENRRYFITV